MSSCLSLLGFPMIIVQNSRSPDRQKKKKIMKLAQMQMDLGMDLKRDADQHLKETAHAEDLTWYYGPTLSRLCLLPEFALQRHEALGVLKEGAHLHK